MFHYYIAARYSNRFGENVEGFAATGFTKAAAKASAYAKAYEKRDALLHSDPSTLFLISEEVSDYMPAELALIKADWKIMEGLQP